MDAPKPAQDTPGPGDTGLPLSSLSKTRGTQATGENQWGAGTCSQLYLCTAVIASFIPVHFT